jgi:hypothetical protein
LISVGYWVGSAVLMVCMKLLGAWWLMLLAVTESPRNSQVSVGRLVLASEMTSRWKVASMLPLVPLTEVTRIRIQFAPARFRVLVTRELNTLPVTVARVVQPVVGGVPPPAAVFESMV